MMLLKASNADTEKGVEDMPSQPLFPCFFFAYTIRRICIDADFFRQAVFCASLVGFTPNLPDE